MPWFALCDKLHSSAAAAKGGVAAVGAYAMAGSWCADHLTDGRIPREVAHRFAPSAVWKKAETAGLVVATEDGYELAGYLDGNPCREEVLARLAAKSEAKQRAGRAGGLRSGMVRRGEAEPKQTRSSAEADAKQEASETKLPSPPSPIPDPPPPSPPSGEGPARKARLGGWKQSLDRVRKVFDTAVGAATGRTVASKRPGGPPENDPLHQIVQAHAKGLKQDALDAWFAAVAKAFVEAIPADRARFYGHYSPDGCLKWLNAGRPDEHTPTERAPPEVPVFRGEELPPPTVTREQSNARAQQLLDDLNRKRASA